MTQEDPRIEAVALIVQRLYGARRDTPTVYKEVAKTILSAADAVAWQPIENAPLDGTKIEVCQAWDADGNPMSADAQGIFTQVAAWREGEGWIVYCSLVQEPRLHFDPTHFRYLTFPVGDAS